MRLRFEGYTLDIDARELLWRDEPVHLSPKAFEFLALLAQRRPRAFSKEELQDALWPDTFVTDSSLAGVVTEVRAGLKDDARNPVFIRTIHRYGYSFCATAVEVAPTSPSVAQLVWPGRRVPLMQGEVVIGRDLSATITIDGAGISRRHARIVPISHGNFAIEDLGSKNGTFVGGNRIVTSTLLAHGDEITIGEIRIRFEETAELPSTITLPRI